MPRGRLREGEGHSERAGKGRHTSAPEDGVRRIEDRSHSTTRFNLTIHKRFGNNF